MPSENAWDKKYRVVDDYQGTDFHLGDVKTAREWKEWALSMNDFNEMPEEDKAAFDKLSAVEAVEYIGDMWQIEMREEK